ncbi:MAG: hypothetical protein KDD44_08680 [Bdellovibrionales bacterium]|nr:hypothetical protein [Bdellovibrionales bacterium]
MCTTRRLICSTGWMARLATVGALMLAFAMNEAYGQQEPPISIAFFSDSVDLRDIILDEGIELPTTDTKKICDGVKRVTTLARDGSMWVDDDWEALASWYLHTALYETDRWCRKRGYQQLRSVGFGCFEYSSKQCRGKFRPFRRPDPNGYPPPGSPNPGPPAQDTMTAWCEAFSPAAFSVVASKNDPNNIIGLTSSLSADDFEAGLCDCEEASATYCFNSPFPRVVTQTRSEG